MAFLLAIDYHYYAGETSGSQMAKPDYLEKT